MTTLMTRPESHSPGGSMPGWSIVADLTPPELINTRWIAVLQRRIALGLVLVLVLCAAAFTFASLRSASAEEDAAAAADRTTYLKRSADKYAGITRIEDTVSTLDTQVATVMKSDVNVAAVLTSIRRDLPGSMSMESISLTLNTDASTEAPGTLDMSGRPTIGAVTISGSGRSLDDLPRFVDGLSAVKGFANVVPTSNQVTDGKSQFSVAFTLNDQLYSHRYDGKKDASR